ncbi:MAG TPA: HypC/HybG/HupF family hydrogenase formation chaperone [Cycloclasticus sp.]|jgi:hydrogenase expression/formation protein HypC|nr:HypC/HybG/HupF family hydrogenase formation chaperone [Cycloclasticus sp.]HIL93434.1 HypC/HybG/HupF family hydrogenase formation chaperone [Cycloclasticus sp.]
MCLAIPGQVIELVDKEKNLVKVDVSGVKRVINVSCIIGTDHPFESCMGDWVLIHVGFAMSIIDEEEALKTIAVLDEMGEMMEQMLEMKSTSDI